MYGNRGSKGEQTLQDLAARARQLRLQELRGLETREVRETDRRDGEVPTAQELQLGGEQRVGALAWGRGRPRSMPRR